MCTLYIEYIRIFKFAHRSSAPTRPRRGLASIRCNTCTTYMSLLYDIHVISLSLYIYIYIYISRCICILYNIDLICITRRASGPCRALPWSRCRRRGSSWRRLTTPTTTTSTTTTTTTTTTISKVLTLRYHYW